MTIFLTTDLKATFRYAFLKSLPVLCGYLFLGFAFGLLLQNAGYNFIWAFFISLFVYAGAMQFVLVGFFSSGVSLITAGLMTLLINSRHAFYGLSFLDKFKQMGKAYPYMIFSLTDETYSLLCSLDPPKKIDEKKAFFFIALFDHSYWIVGSTLGAAVGQMLTFNTTGINFAMTALFVTIFIEQWQTFKTHIPALTGLFSAILCLLIFGPDQFILPTMILSVAILILLRSKIQNFLDDESAPIDPSQTNLENQEVQL